MSPQNYVLGFLFNENMARVLLICKAKPTWMAGKWNGIGGHVEPGEDIHTAMEREADEEAGITPGSINWHLFGEMSFRRTGARVFLFSAHDSGTNPGCDGILIAPTPAQETEPIEFVDYNERFNLGRMMSNLRWLIPMALANEFALHDGPCKIEFP